MLAQLTPAQLDFLSGSHQRNAPNVRLSPEAQKSAGTTAHAYQAEDLRRAAALRKHKRTLLRTMPDSHPDPDEVADLLAQYGDNNRAKPIRPCLASAVYMRGRSIGVLGAVLDLVRQHPQLDRSWVTMSSPVLNFDRNQHWSNALRRARKLLEYELETTGATRAPGFVIALANGYYDPSTRKFRLEYRGIAAGDKLRMLRASPALMGKSPPDSRMRISIRPIRDLTKELSGMLPNSVRELVPSVSGNTSWQPMREPLHSFYLWWLAQNSLADLTVVDGAFYWNGGFKLRECSEKTPSSGGHLQSGPVHRGVPRARPKSPPLGRKAQGKGSVRSAAPAWPSRNHVQTGRVFPGV